MSAMRTVAIRNLRAHKVRLALTLISVLLGTAFVAGSFVFTDTLKHSFDNIFATSDKGVDARVQARHDYDPGVPTNLIATIGAVPGAAVVEPQINGPVVLVKADGTKVESNGAPSVGGLWATRSVNPIPSFVTGHAPRTDHQVVVNDGAATKHGLHTGDQVKVVVSNSSVVDATISGIYRSSVNTGGYIGALFTRGEAMRLFTDGRHVTAVDVAAAPGVSEQTLTDRIAKILPGGLQAKTGTQVRDAETADISSALSFVNYILLGFGIVALLVGTFIIYNTFAMIVAQRQRELALLRAIGAGRKQVRRSVVFEAGVIGIVGSALGLAGGIGLAYGLHALLDSFDLGLPSGGMVLSTRTILITLILGTAVTLLAGLAPARRAARIAPVAAMREEFSSPSASGLRRRTAIGVVVAAASVAATVAGVISDKAGAAASFTGLGLVTACVAAMLLSPVLARWVIVPLGRIVGRPFGTVGQLARTNAIRNPRRTAATAFALTLGLILVAGIAVVGASIKGSLGNIIDNTVQADYIVTTNNQLYVPTPAVAAVRTVPGVATTTALHDLNVSINGKHDTGTAVDGPLAGSIALDMQHGAADITGHNLVISKKLADSRHWAVGDTLRMSAPGRGTVTEHVAGVYADNQLAGPYLTGGDVWRQLTPRNELTSFVVLVQAKPGTDLATLRSGLEKATNDYYVVTVQDREQFKGQTAAQVNGLIALLYGLLGLAIVIAILGIINTLALSVVERRREIGMLRAVGMQRKQVRRTIYLESLLISVFGAVLGLVLGLTFGSLFTRTLRNAGLNQLSVPWGQALLFLGLAAVVGVLAALWPGVRASRTPPLEAISAA
ncbi:MAG: putative transport system permease protein [Pseudonocardiales bacterium]|nr:putative transport system permease protein [Pseudonocardiales bacterium]